jgi:hypothetical protein
MSLTFAEKTAEFVASITPAQKAAWMAERRLIAQARAEMAAEIDAEIAAEEERKTKRRHCLEPLTPAQNRNTGWYVSDRHNELHKQR